MSSFFQKKSKCGKLCYSASIWRNRLPNRIECLWRPMVTVFYRKKRAEIRFVSSNPATLTWATRSVKIGPGRLRTINCRQLDPIAKNAFRAIGCYSTRHFHASTCHGKDFLHVNALSHTSKMVRNYLETLNWEVLLHVAYLPDLAPSDDHLFSSMGHALAEQHFVSYEDVRKWLDEWFASKEKEFFWCGLHKLPKRWEECVASEGKYFEYIFFAFYKKNSGFKLVHLVKR